MQKNTLRSAAQIALFVLPLVFLPGCAALDWLKEKLGMSQPKMMEMSDEMDMQDEMEMNAEKKTRNELASGSPALIIVDGKVMVTMKDLDDELDSLIAQYPELASLLPMMPDAKSNLLKGMLSQIIVDVWADRNLSGNTDYAREKSRACREAVRLVNQTYFSKNHPVEVSEAELRSFYEKHKNQMPDLMVTRGGVNAVGIAFKDEAQAQAFLSSVKDGNLSNTAAAQGMAGQVREFKDVDQLTPGTDQAIRAALVGMTRFPSTQLVKTAKEFWVIQGLSKDEPKYQEFAKVKDLLKPAAEQEKRMEHLESLIATYKKQYQVEVNEEAVKATEAAAEAPSELGEMEEEEMPMMPQPA